VRLVRLEIGRLPGVAPARRLALDGLHPETNVLVGPNASGKSSVVRALRALLAPDSVPAHDVDVAAEFVDAGRSWRVERFGTTVAWREDGVACGPPPLPDPSLLSCYAIGVEELMAAGDPDVAAADLIARELAGGYDLRAIRDAPPFKASVHRARTARAAFERAERRRRQVAGEARTLREDEDRRADWERERDEAAAARVDAARLERARALADRLDAEARAAERASAFPAGMERLVGTEAQRLAASRERIEAARREREAALARRDAADRTIRDARLGPAPPTAAELEERRATVRSLERWEAEIARLERERTHARADRDRALAELGGTPGRSVTLDPATLRRVEHDVEEARRRAARADATRERVDDLERWLADAVGGVVGEAEAAARLDRHREARATLSSWAASEALVAAPARPRRWIRAIAVVAGGAGAAGLALAGPTGDPATLGAWAAVLLTAVATWAAWSTVPPRAPGAGRRPPVAELRALDVEPPEAWDAPSVARRVAALDRRIATWALAERQSAEHARVSTRLAADEAALREAEARLRRVADRVGFEPDGLGADLARWLDLARALDDATARLAGLDAELGDARARRAAAHDDVAAFLATRDEAPVGADPDAAALEARLADLAARVEAHDRGLRERAAADADLTRLDRDLTRRAEEVAELHRTVGVEPGPRADAELAARLARLPDWRAARAAAADAAADVRAAEASLRDAPELREAARAGRRAELDARHAAAERAAAGYDDVVDRLARLEARIERAGADRNLERARAELEAASAELEAAREEALLAEAGRFLLDEVEREHRDASAPEVLERAQAWFETFTRHRWALTFDPRAAADDRFRARDLERGEARRLEELSTATRMQLFVAVRVAFASEAERGRHALPIVLDEALTTSDAARFEAVARSLGTLALGGRQVIYLSARHEDAAAWRAAVAAVGAGCTVLELSPEGLAREGAAPPARLALPHVAAVPPPGDRGPEAYAAELGVPGLDPWADADAAHPFHLLRDRLELLHRCLAAGATAVGPARSLLRGPLGPEVASEEERALFSARARAADAWLAAWRRGRGAPVARPFFETSTAVTATFLDRVVELAASLGGDAEALLTAIDDGALPRFQRASRATLEEELAAAGHLATGAPLDAAGRLERMAAAVRSESGSEHEPDLAELRALEAWLAVGAAAGVAAGAAPGVSPRDPAS
jgi:DNA repair exonuclease SbcCD ATPase subunit